MTKVILSEGRKLFTKILHFVQNDSIMDFSNRCAHSK